MIRHSASLGVLIALTTLACSTARGAEAPRPLPEPQHGWGRAPMVSVWIPGNPVLRRGDRAPVLFRTDRAAYVTVVRIDTDGRLSILYPEDPFRQRPVRGGVVYPVHRRGAFRVHDPFGLGYVFAIASDEPFDYYRISRGRRWDYGYVRHVRYDPFEAMHHFAEMIVPGRYQYSLDFAEYHVGRRAPYPRYMCAEVVYALDPYLYPCRRFVIVYRTSRFPYGHPRYYGYEPRVIYIRQPVRYAHIEPKGPPVRPGTPPPVNEIERRRRDAGDDRDERRSGVVTPPGPRRIESEQRAPPGQPTTGPAGQPTTGPAGPPRRDPGEIAPRNQPPAGIERTDDGDPRTPPRRDAEPPPVIRGEPRTQTPARAEPRQQAPPARAEPRTQDRPAQRAEPRGQQERRSGGAERREERTTRPSNAPERGRRTPD